VFVDLGLVEQDRAFGVDAGGEVARGDLARGAGKLSRVLPDGDRVQVDDAEDAVGAGVLGLDEALDRAEIIAERQAAKANKDFARADAIRDELAAQGIILKDSREGTTWVIESS